MQNHEAAKNRAVAVALASDEASELRKRVPDLDVVVSRYYRHAEEEDLEGRASADILGAAVSHLRFAHRRPQGRAIVRVFTPTVADQGWSSDHTVIEIVDDDMPFIVDSVTSALNTSGHSLHMVLHPVVVVRRDVAGDFRELLDVSRSAADPDAVDVVVESWLHIEIDRVSNPDVLAAIEKQLVNVLSDVSAAVEDWQRMKARTVHLAKELADSPPPTVDAAEVSQSVGLLKWLANNHFTFLGYREYSLETNDEGQDSLVSRPATGLGILRSDTTMATPFAQLPPEISAKAREPRPLILTKANRRSTVHRPAYLDYIGVKEFDEEGKVIGERRILGLFSSGAYSQSVAVIPVLQNKVRRLQEISGYPPGSHSSKDLLQFCETYPRDELFQVSPEQLLPVAHTVLGFAERRRTRLFVRTDDYGRFVSALVYLPRNRFTTTMRLRLSDVLKNAFGAASIEATSLVGESVLARLHFVARMPSGVPVPNVDISELERTVIAATRTWDDDFADAIEHELGEERASALLETYLPGIPESYKESVSPRSAVADVERLSELVKPGDCSVALHDVIGLGPAEQRFVLYRRDEPVLLFEILPVFASLGVEVSEQRPHHLESVGDSEAWIYDVGLRLPAAPIDESEVGLQQGFAQRFCEAFLATWRGETETDFFNSLVVSAGLTSQEVAWVRSWALYSRQLSATFSSRYIAQVLGENGHVTGLLVQLFRARLDPDIDGEQRERLIADLQHELNAGIDAVATLDADRILRQLLAIVLAALRTNAFQAPNIDGTPRALALKLEPGLIPGVPEPVPAFEIWVTSPRVTGTHLRFGPVARGGLRWSDRRQDVRTEVLGLVKAQSVKNAVIVPVGAKGGFVVKRPRNPADRDMWQADGIAVYREFVSALLDVTDNIVRGQVVPPQRTVRWDGDDSYLVVAADKGTAAFSDIANDIASDYGFWLGDAFASGGSEGYDHKEMGITAKGAWESVKRHFRDLGVDVQAEPVTVVGIGDMSGDVFGNGMLLSRELKIVIAFDHRDIFVDPRPDPHLSFAERERLFALPRSSWADYDRSLISEGGGVFPRTLKSIPIGAPMRECLGLGDGITEMTPDELVRAALLAPADLLWNGGIGTYVKSRTESQLDVGDKANDAVRVNGGDLRVRVVGEGGNLGLTQRGRIEAALIGVQLNTDAIDNSAGVDCSDHEVNIKIVLDAVVDSGDLTMKQRNELLVEMTAEVSELVLLDNYYQNIVLGNSRVQASGLMTVHRRMIQDFENRGLIDRELEALPTDEEMAARQQAGQGLTSPELSVLLSYVKIALTSDLIESPIADEDWFSATIATYFPKRIVERYGDRLPAFPLRRQLIATIVSNDIVNRGGLSFVHRAVEETGASPVQVARAYAVARDVFDLESVWNEINALDGTVPTQSQVVLYLEVRRLLDRATRWVLALRGGTVNVTGEIERFKVVVSELRANIDELLVGGERLGLAKHTTALADLGAPEPLARKVASLLDAFRLLDIDDIAARSGEPPGDVARVYFSLSNSYRIDTLLEKITLLPRDDRWSNLARAAMRSDLYSVLAGLTSKVLRATSANQSPEARIADWESRNAEGQLRASKTLDEIESSELFDLATLSVALRVLRTLVQQGSGMTPLPE